MTATAEPDGPLVQSISIAFRVAALATILLAVLWLCSDFRQVPPGTTAVVSRFGRIVRVRSTGLLPAWPQPIEEVRLLPGPDRQLALAIEPQPLGPDLIPVPIRATPLRIGGVSPAGKAGSYLTADGGVVLLDVAVTYSITDPVAFVLSETHVSPALNRLFRAAAVFVAAGHTLDDFLVVDQGRAAASRAAAGTVVRDEILALINRRLARLGTDGAALGVEVVRLDLTASLPEEARLAFERVLTASQQADQITAVARTAVIRRLQDTERQRGDLLNAARAHAAELVAGAHTDTDGILALEASMAPGTRDDLLQQVYLDRLAKLMPKFGRVIAIDPRDNERLILPGEGNRGDGK